MANRLVFGIINSSGQPVLNPATGERIMRKAPFGYVYPGYPPPEYAMYGEGWEAYTGSASAISADCITPVTPVTGSPTWRPGFGLPAVVPGQQYSFPVYWDTDVLAASGQTITGVSGGTLPAWLSPSVSPSERRTTFSGNAPSSLTSLSITLIANQSDGKNTPKDFTATVSAATVRMRFDYSKVTGELLFREGPSGSGGATPTVQLINTPSSYPDHTIYNMDPETVSVESVVYNFRRTYPGIVTGHYDFKTVWLGVTLYGSLEIMAGKSDLGVITLSPTVIPALTGSQPMQDGDPVFEGVTPTSTFRIIDAPHSNPLLVGEGNSLQLQIEQQYSDNSWAITNASRTWLVNGPGGNWYSINSSGLLTINPNSISSNQSLSVQATFADLTVVVSPAITVTNQPDN